MVNLPQITLEQVRQRVHDIALQRTDPEVAHIMEDELHQEILAAIATGVFIGEYAAELAREAIKTKEIDFPRWHA